MQAAYLGGQLRLHNGLSLRLDLWINPHADKRALTRCFSPHKQGIYLASLYQFALSLFGWGYEGSSTGTCPHRDLQAFLSMFPATFPRIRAEEKYYTNCSAGFAAR